MEKDAERELLVGYGENHLVTENIRKHGGTIRVSGSDVPAEHSVFVAGRSVPLGSEGKFVAEEILPSGQYTVGVAILDRAGNGDLFLRDLDLKKNDWFYVGIADLTVARDRTTGPADIVTKDSAHFNNELSADGRLAYYTKGKFGSGWELTSSADSLEGPVKDIFRNLSNTPDALFRNIKPQYFYPTFGDDSTVEEGAPTFGKFYLKMKKEENYFLWGNFKIEGRRSIVVNEREGAENVMGDQTQSRHERLVGWDTVTRVFWEHQKAIMRSVEAAVQKAIRKLQLG